MLANLKNVLMNFAETFAYKSICLFVSIEHLCLGVIKVETYTVFIQWNAERTKQEQKQSSKSHLPTNTHKIRLGRV